MLKKAMSFFSFFLGKAFGSQAGTKCVHDRNFLNSAPFFSLKKVGICFDSREFLLLTYVSLKKKEKDFKTLSHSLF